VFGAIKFLILLIPLTSDKNFYAAITDQNFQNETPVLSHLRLGYTGATTEIYDDNFKVTKYHNSII